MNLGFPEMIFIFLLALIIFGPKKLPEIGRQIGRAMAEFKRASNEFKSQLENEMRQLEIEEENKRIMAAHPALLPPEQSVPSAPLPPHADPDPGVPADVAASEVSLAPQPDSATSASAKAADV